MNDNDISKNKTKDDGRSTEEVSEGAPSISEDAPSVEDAEEYEEEEEEEESLGPPRPNLRFLVFSVIILLGSSAMMVWFARDLPFLRAAILSELVLGDAMKVDVKTLIPERVAQIDGTPSTQRTIAFQESGKLLSLQSGAKKMAPLTGLPHFYVEWTDRAAQSGNSEETVHGSPTHFRGRLTTRESMGPVYDKVWVFFDCLKVHGIKQCGLCMGKPSLDECRKAFVCADMFKEEECGQLLSSGRGAAAQNAVLAEARAVELEEFDTIAGRLQQTAEKEKSSHLETLSAIRAEILKLRAQVLRIRSKKVFDAYAALDKASLEKLRALMQETDRLKKEQLDIDASLRPMKSLLRISDGLLRLGEKTGSLLENVARISDAAAKKIASADPNSKDGVLLEKNLSDLHADILRGDKTESASKADQALVADYLKNLSLRFGALKSRVDAVPFGAYEELAKWAAEADPSGETPQGELDFRILKGLADLERMAAAIPIPTKEAGKQKDADSKADLRERLNGATARLNAIRERKKTAAATPGYQELTFKEQIETVEKSLKDSMSFDEAAGAMLAIQLTVAEVADKKLYVENFKSAPGEAAATLAAVTDARVAKIQSSLKDISSALDPKDFVLLDGELPMDKLWSALICLVLLLMAFSNGRKIVRFINTYRKR